MIQKKKIIEENAFEIVIYEKWTTLFSPHSFEIQVISNVSPILHKTMTK